MPLSRLTALLALLFLASLACSRAGGAVDYTHITPIGGQPTDAPSNPLAPLPTPLPSAAPTLTLLPTATRIANLPTATPRPTLDISVPPTPDATHASVLQRQTVEEYTVRRGDTLGEIGEHYGVPAAEIAQANQMTVQDTLIVGQKLLIPLPKNQRFGPAVKLLPDSELVYGPGTVEFDLPSFIQRQGGYLARYEEELPGAFLDGVNAATLSGSEIVRLVAQRYSVNPRLLLTLLEFHSQWVSNPRPGDNTLVYPMGRVEVGREGLYRQLSWTANQLNFGYYTWRVGAIVSVGFPDNSLRLISPTLNAGTVGLQYYLSKLYNPTVWEQALRPQGALSAYHKWFGSPLAHAFEPLAPPILLQPKMQLPFESDKVWAFTGGPHGAWDVGSAWGALDFAPPAEAEGCTPSDEWVVAVAPGYVVRSEYGGVVQDLDGDGYEGTGWVMFYMHLETRDRIAAGTWLNAGDRLGHPSCEGGVSNGTHLHLARKYNGEWISADGTTPFVLDGWSSTGLGREYDGYLTKGDVSLEACDCRSALNEISRP